nr:reverse transcriptase domain-containing protein [Tanacetum cinerariifolium]
MRTRSSSNLPVVSPSNPSTSNPKCRNRRRSKQPFILEESPIDTMDDQRTMAELLRTPTEGYEEAIVVPLILAEQFELKHSLFNMMTSDQFFRLEKDNPHDHIRWFNKITSTIKYKDVPNSAIKLMLFPFSLAEAACRTTNLRNEISNFQQRFDESFHEAWDRYKDLLRACPHHGFTELYQLDTFYNALNLTDQDTLNATAGGNMLERRTQDVLTIIENKSKVRNSRNKLVVSQVKSFDAISNSSSEIAKLTHAVNQQTSVVTTVMTAILKQFQATPPPASVKAVKEICVTCGAAAVNYNQGNSVYRPSGMANQIRPPGFAQPNVQNNKNRFSQPQGYNRGSRPLPSNIVANPKGELKTITTQSAVILKKLLEKLGDPGKLLIPYGFSKLKCKALADLGASINLMPLSVWKKLGLPEPISTRMTLKLANRAICTPAGIARDVFVPISKFTFLADFVIVDYESDPRVPLILGRPVLLTAHALIDVHGKEMILRDGDERLTLNMRHDTSSYSNQSQKESINLINVFNNSSEDFLKDLFSTNQPSDNHTFPSHPELTVPEVKNDIFDLEGGNVLPEKLLDLDSTKDLHPPLHVNPLSGSITYSSP